MRVLTSLVAAFAAVGLVAAPVQAASSSSPNVDVQKSSNKRWVLEKEQAPPAAAENAPAPSEPAPIAQVEGETTRATVTFATGSSKLDETGKKTLDEVASSIGEKPRELSITGHTDA